MFHAQITGYFIIAGAWGVVLAGTIAYLYNRKIPTQLKIIQGRIVAQAFLLSGAGVAAGYHFLHEGDAPKKEFGQGQSPRYNYKNFDLPKDEEGAEQAPASAKMQ